MIIYFILKITFFLYNSVPILDVLLHFKRLREWDDKAKLKKDLIELIYWVFYAGIIVSSLEIIPYIWCQKSELFYWLSSVDGFHESNRVFDPKTSRDFFSNMGSRFDYIMNEYNSDIDKALDEAYVNHDAEKILDIKNDISIAKSKYDLEISTLNKRYIEEIERQLANEAGTQRRVTALKWYAFFAVFLYFLANLPK